MVEMNIEYTIAKEGKPFPKKKERKPTAYAVKKRKRNGSYRVFIFYSKRSKLFLIPPISNLLFFNGYSHPLIPKTDWVIYSHRVTYQS